MNAMVPLAQRPTLLRHSRSCETSAPSTKHAGDPGRHGARPVEAAFEAPVHATGRSRRPRVGQSALCLALCLALWASTMLSGCESTVQAPDGADRIDSNTNWLKGCVADSDCGGGGQHCICGVCTSECGATTCDTESLPGAVCVVDGQSAFSDLCAAVPTIPSGVCLPECSDDAQCEGGQVCNDGACVPAREQRVNYCRDDMDCPPEALCKDNLCEVPMACESDAQCAPSETCDDKECVPLSRCRTDDACSENAICDNTQCVRLPDCGADDECPDGAACDEGVCQRLGPCRSDLNCPGLSVCLENECRRLDGCNEGRACPEGTRCAETGLCVLDVQCAENRGCGEDEICDSGQCLALAACRSDDACPTGTQCSNNRCIRIPEIACRRNEECPNDAICYNERCFTRASCEFDSDCAQGTLCADDNACYPALRCTNDDGCPEGARCAENQCRPTGAIDPEACPPDSTTLCGQAIGLRPDLLYTCSDGEFTQVEACEGGCEQRTSGGDQCAPVCPEGDGLYCGQTVERDERLLYRCTGDNFTIQARCARGCEVVRGGDDACF